METSDSGQRPFTKLQIWNIDLYNTKVKVDFLPEVIDDIRAYFFKTDLFLF